PVSLRESSVSERQALLCWKQSCSTAGSLYIRDRGAEQALQEHTRRNILEACCRDSFLAANTKLQSEQICRQHLDA
ncbi:hypothetical protein Nmel_001121, partial [Mimus melanotis]